MKKNSELSDELIGRLVNGNLSDEDILELNEWESHSDENRSVIKDITQIRNDYSRLIQMEQIDSHSALLNVKKQMKQKSNIRFKSVFNQTISIWQKVAAVIIIPLLAFSIYLYINKTAEKEIAWNEVSTPYGLSSVITLPDSTVVEINSRSKLRYPLAFTGKERIVELEGEAFFRVKKNHKIPFIVKCNKIDIQAVGTAFNVLEFKSGNVITSLVEGKVNILKRDGKNERTLASMVPGQTVRYDCKKDKIIADEKGETDKYTAWREGKLIFRNDPLTDVLEQLSRRYNVDFEINDKLSNKYAYTGSFVDKSLDKILTYIELTTPIVFESNPEKKDEKTVIRVRSNRVYQPKN